MRGSCHICKEPTEQTCTDCKINLDATVYICQKVACMDEHEKYYCSGPNRQIRSVAEGVVEAFAMVPTQRYLLRMRPGIPGHQVVKLLTILSEKLGIQSVGVYESEVLQVITTEGEQ
jgi:hypothetical protein